MQLNTRKTNNGIRKWVENQMDISPKETYRWPTTYEKMLNISHYQRNANLNYNEVLSHTSQNAHH